MLAQHLGVRYIYADAVPAIAVSHDQPQPDIAAGELKMLPTDLFHRLRDFVELGDMDAIAQAIAEIRLLNPELATNVARLADRFEYERLLRKLGEVR